MKSFTITYKSKDYVCSMNRAVLRELESKNGFNILNDDKILNRVYILFYGALKTNHPDMTLAKATTMLDELTTPDEKGECDYSFTEIAKALSEVSEGCIAEANTVKNAIKVG